jgi:hypothetical protein
VKGQLANKEIVDPWFNFRATKYLVQNGFYSFWDWFDDRTLFATLGRQEKIIN